MLLILDPKRGDLSMARL